MYVLGALAVVDGGLPLPWAVAATVARPGARVRACSSSSPARRRLRAPGAGGDAGDVSACSGARGAQLAVPDDRGDVLVRGAGARRLRSGSRRSSSALGGSRAAARADGARGSPSSRRRSPCSGSTSCADVLRVVLPLSLVSTAVLIVGLYVASDDPRFAARPGLRRRPTSTSTWTGFATFVTVMCGASLTLVTNVADLCRYTPTRRDLPHRAHLASSVLAVAVTTFVGGYAAAATGDAEPLHRRRGAHASSALLVLLLAAIVVQTHRGQPHERLHGRALARERGAAARPLSRDARRRGGGDRALGVPRRASRRRQRGSRTSATWPRR